MDILFMLSNVMNIILYFAKERRVKCYAEDLVCAKRIREKWGRFSFYLSIHQRMDTELPPHPVKIYVSTISDSERCSELAWMISLRLEAIFVASSWELPHQEFGKRFCAYLGIATLAKSKGWCQMLSRNAKKKAWKVKRKGRLAILGLTTWD